MKLVRKLLSVMASTFLIVLLVASARAQQWHAGQVLLGVGGGQLKVYDPVTDTIVDTLSDGLSGAGATNGLALNPTWHPTMSDSGSGSISKIVRFRLSPHDPNNPSPVPDVLSISNGSCGGATNPVSIVTVVTGAIIVANAKPATICVFQPSGSVTAFPIANRFVDKTLASIDIDSTGTLLYITSGGPNIQRMQLATGTISTFATVNGERFFGIRVLPTGGLIAAAQANVLRFNSGGGLAQTYTITGQKDARVLTLDPNLQGADGPPEFFWAASPNNGILSHVNLATGSFTSVTPSGISAIQSLATYGGFAADHPAVNAYQPQVLSGSPSNTPPPYLFGNDTMTITGFAFPSGFSTTLSVLASAYPASSGTSESGEECTPTTADGQCVFWQLDTSPTLSSPALLGLKIFSNSTAVNSNTRILRDTREEFTFGVRNLHDPMGGSRSAATLNQVPGNPPDGGCNYFPPVQEGATLTNPGNVTFRFQCSSLPGTALHTLQTATSPRISILQIVPGSAAVPFFPSLTTPGGLTGGTCCTVNKYRYDPGSNTFVINVDMSNGSGMFLVTTFDDSGKVAAFDVLFSKSK